MREPISRRELVGGGLFFGAVFLAGCRSVPTGSASAGLPAPVVPGSIEPQTLESRVQVTAGPEAEVAAGPEGVDQVEEVVQAGPVAPEILPRSAWTKEGVLDTRELVPMGGIRKITVHHDGLDAFTSVRLRDSAARIEAIRRIHVGAGGWGVAPSNHGRSDIGYHFAIDPAGRIFACRHIHVQGCHVDSYNQHNLGILCLGDFDRQRPSPATLASLQSLIAFHMLKDELRLAEVRTHRECPNPSFRCPGEHLQAAMVAMRAPNGGLDSLRRASSRLARRLAQPLG